VRVFVPAALETDRDDGENLRGYAVLTGSTYPPLCVAWCWSYEAAKLVHAGLGGQQKGYWIAPALFAEHSSP
jgi:hypothetical protein